jgi:hypothetical protein
MVTPVEVDATVRRALSVIVITQPCTACPPC